MLGMDMRCVRKSVAVAHSRCLYRMCVHTGINEDHLLEDKRECIRGGVESWVLRREDWS
jgi:hypothetical protein